MRLVEKFLQSGRLASAGKDPRAGNEKKKTTSSIGDGAIDTLGCVIRTMGDVSFPLDDGADPDAFRSLCNEFACHVENGAAVPCFDIPLAADGSRQWSQVRRFFVDRRSNEQSYVLERIGDYREVVQDLVDGLRQIGQRDHDTETLVLENLGKVEQAVNSGKIPQIKAAVSDTIQTVSEKFVEQKAAYESQIRELNDRMSCLREDLVQAQEEMQRDSLTQAYNRGAFDAAMHRALNMNFILGKPVTLIMLDLDNFKQVNDTHGHAAGDEVLRLVGEALARSFIRKSDVVARYGGDEFAVILTDTSASNALPLIERFMKRVRKILIPGADASDTVSCSAGYSEIVANDTVADVIKRADTGLYDAKKAGRNCHRSAFAVDD